MPRGLPRGSLLQRLNEVLLQRIHAHKDIVLIIDESQNMGFEALEHLRLLSNLETDKQKLLQIILLGQPELQEKVKILGASPEAFDIRLYELETKQASGN